MPNAKKKIIHIVQTLQNVPEIKNIYLFGSRARGDATSRSDIDMAKESKKPFSIRKQRHIKELAEALKQKQPILTIIIGRCRIEKTALSLKVNEKAIYFFRLEKR